jgi:hypothetical protein
MRITTPRCECCKISTPAASQRAPGIDQNIVQEGGKALLLATHNAVIAEACDWIHEMKDGRIVASHPRGMRNSIS